MDDGKIVAAKMADVEDIMCDQCILTSEFDMQFDSNTQYLVVPTRNEERKSHQKLKNEYTTSSKNLHKLRVAIDLVARLLLPPVSTVYYTILRNPPQTVLNIVRRQILSTLVAFVANHLSKSLASAQRGREPPPPMTEEGSGPRAEAEKSVECAVLAQPEGEPLVDVIFVHGLHGAVDKTWRQGTWRREGHKLINQSPVRRQSTENLFVPPTDRSLKRTLGGMYSRIPSKIPKKSDRTENSTFEAPCERLSEQEENPENSNEYSDCWPRDWIPKDCPFARVIAVNYSTDVLWCPTWLKKRKRTDLVTRSQEMLEELQKLEVGKRPIVWVGHSKGGLFIKQIMINAWENSEEVYRNVFRQSKGIMWYSVPHRGSTLADCAFPLLRRSIEVLEVQRNCDFVLELHKKFLDILEQEDLKIDIFSFIETAFTLMSFIYIKIVAYDSADPNIGIKCDVPLDHREICKPAGRDCFLYLELIKLVNKNVPICIAE